ncbi:LacI family DNA-binding transcriptional regulator [Treponema parvum]|uniref:LacI family DNA-binding transcriptional regulator n=1 Tax=Treponema parvum TaxID=138851 RepID=A0A975F3U9_9SPIR|nr:LacI family DNA-binding transcriptional regulator [Treponema parvum]QTQ13877.1 LacI family DNA-binding transcriptional regulator [Treponema parvum]
MSITIKDVANDSKVSISTVSLVLNESPLVKLETRLKVQQSIKRLNYVPNKSARILITKVNKAIGVIRAGSDGEIWEGSFKGTSGSFFSGVMWGIEQEVSKAGYTMLVDWYKYDASMLPPIANRNYVDGLICVGGILKEAFLEELKETGLPVVLVGARDRSLDYIDVDSDEAVYQATKYIISCGHRKIAFLNGPKFSQSSGRKLRGYLRAVQEFGVSGKTSLFCKSFSGESGYMGCEKICSKNPRPTAFVCASDSIAIGAARYFYDNKIRCPDDVSIIGYENGPLAEYAIPALTTMDIGKSYLGQKAVSILMNRIINPKARHVGVLGAGVLCVRGSVSSLK